MKRTHDLLEEEMDKNVYSFKNPQQNIIFSNEDRSAQLSSSPLNESLEGGCICVSNLSVSVGESIDFSIRLEESFFFPPPDEELVKEGYPEGKYHVCDQLMVGLIADMESKKGMKISDLMEEKYCEDTLLLEQCYNGGEYMICCKKYVNNKTYIEKYRQTRNQISSFVPDMEKKGDIRHYRINLIKTENSYFEIGCNDSRLVRVSFPKDSIQKKEKRKKTSSTEKRRKKRYTVVICFIVPDKITLLPFQHDDEKNIKNNIIIKDNIKQQQQHQNNNNNNNNNNNCSGCGKESKDLKVCSRCKQEYYCSRECQLKCWRSYHKDQCSKLRKQYLKAINKEEKKK